ncbi:hypothetical protein BV25DRAFT_1831454 [Artomyces pyxidatus]|uniref:Uncharacterized protein n=1 Tax=Artomyces pyxidatus TaxID=48021 RepID=A0ACB8SKX5_9AGAM|nr:hypothetical protein BV25DRAFT_1831454 [Artomyces pyxidatus]
MPPLSTTSPQLSATLVRRSWMTQNMTKDNKEQKFKALIFVCSVIGGVALGYAGYAAASGLRKKYATWRAGRGAGREITETEETHITGENADLEDVASDRGECSMLHTPAEKHIRDGHPELEKGRDCPSVVEPAAED